MTRREAIKLLNELYIRADITDEYGDMEDMQPYEDAVDMAIQALEQESILDKIRAEIEKQQKWLLQAGYTAYNTDIAFDSIKRVIAESEE